MCVFHLLLSTQIKGSKNIGKSTRFPLNDGRQNWVCLPKRILKAQRNGETSLKSICIQNIRHSNVLNFARDYMLALVPKNRDKKKIGKIHKKSKSTWWSKRSWNTTHVFSYTNENRQMKSNARQTLLLLQRNVHKITRNSFDGFFGHTILVLMCQQWRQTHVSNATEIEICNCLQSFCNEQYAKAKLSSDENN